MYFKCMLKSIGAFVSVLSREVVRFWEGPLLKRGSAVYMYIIPTYTNDFGIPKIIFLECVKSYFMQYKYTVTCTLLFNYNNYSS